MSSGDGDGNMLMTRVNALIVTAELAALAVTLHVRLALIISVHHLSEYFDGERV
jgi:hypothetical protein